MKFEWDAAKSLSNRNKHGITFDEAVELWKDNDRIELDAYYGQEPRLLLIAKFNRKLWTAIFTYRHHAIRIISVRRARKKERKIYENKLD